MTVKTVLTVALDAQQELAERVAGPVFSDEYTDALVAEDFDVIDALEREQEDLASKYLSAWSEVATALSDERNIDLYVNLDGSDDDGHASDKFKIDVSSKITVFKDGGKWVVTRL